MDPSSNEWPTPSAERLRRALDPEETTVERVVRRAQAAHATAAPEPRRPVRLFAALAATAALAALLTLALPDRHAPAPQTLDEGRISISNQGEIVLARRSDGAGRWIVRSGSGATASSSQVILVLHGDRR